VRPSNLDIVRSIYLDWERGDFASVEWADPEIEFVIVDGPAPGGWTGLEGMAKGWRGFLDAWEEFRSLAEDYRELDENRVAAFVQLSGRGRGSELELGQMRTTSLALFELAGGKVVRLALYWDRERALDELGLSAEG